MTCTMDGWEMEEERRKFWAAAERAAAEVAKWPWWKKGDPAPPEELPVFPEEP